MRAWFLDFTLDAEKDLVALDPGIRCRIVEKLEWLVDNFDAIIPQILTGEFKDFYKLRVEDWRVIYKINWNKSLITVCYIDRRDKIYKKKK